MSDGLFEIPGDWWHRRLCGVCGCALAVIHTHSYVVQRQDWVKIGATSNVRRRIGELARPAWSRHLISPEGMDWHEPLATLAIFDVDVEHELHLRFASEHVAGEWFLPGEEMNAWLAEPVPPAQNRYGRTARFVGG